MHHIKTASVRDYVPDANCAVALRKITNAELPLVASDVVELEFVNAVGLHVFRKQMRPAQAAAALRSFHDDVENALLKLAPFPPATFRQALRLATQRTPVLGTRSLDILQIAAALALEAEVLYTFDVKQGKLAVAEGLRLG